jgi:hypothetical protein
MKSITISTLFTIGLAASISPYKREDIKLPIVPDIENTFHPFFDEKPVECAKFNIKLDSMSKYDKKWLLNNNGEKLILTEKNMIIKIGDTIYKPNKKYDVIDNQSVNIYNQDTLVIKIDYINFKNMMSYADNEYLFMLIPITFAFYDCH